MCELDRRLPMTHPTSAVAVATAEVEPPLRRKPRFPSFRYFESGNPAFKFCGPACADSFFLPFLTNKNLQNVAVLKTSLLTVIAVVFASMLSRAVVTRPSTAESR